jgi:zinc protease
MRNDYFRKLCLAAALLASIFAAQAALNLADPVPIGPQVKVGKLANGLTYYIQKNNRPEKRLELRLVVKAGSVLEDDDQQGLAHFTEHMAFNGSTHFKKHELISYLQSIGLKFGADLNAYTGFNETVYILPIPTEKRENVEKGFLVLEDWAQGVSFNDTDIDMERAIVLEELRSGKGAQDRMNKRVFPKMFSGSKYADRLPIGIEDILKKFKFEAIKRFYKDWYRPDLMAVVVVGDIDPKDAQALVESHFGQLKNPVNERARDYPRLPVRASSESLVVTDKEATNNMMQILYPVMDDKVVMTLGDTRMKIEENLFGTMLGLRIQELTQQASPPFVWGGSRLAPMMPGYRAFSSSMLLGRQGIGPAVDALVQENERARQFGFNAAELDRAKKQVLRAFEQANAEREKTDSGTYAAEYLRNFLVLETIPGIENEFNYAREFLPSITLDEMNRIAKTVIPDKAAKLVVYTGTDKPESQTPTEPELLGSVTAAEQMTVKAKEEKLIAAALMTQLPKAGSIVAQRKNEALGLTELDLSNGVKVILKPTDFQNDQIIMGAARFGGHSRYSMADIYNGGYAGAVASVMGLAEFSPMDLQKMMAGKLASVQVGMNELLETVHGASSHSDLEAMLQLVHLKFGATRKDADLFQSFISRSQDAAKNAIAQPESVYWDATQTTLYSAHPRVWLTPRPANFDQINIDRARAIYLERFASAKGFTFIFVGNFEVDAIKPLLATYLASLPTPDMTNAYVDLGIRPVKGVVKKEVHAGTEPKARVSIFFTGPAAYSQDEDLRLKALIEVMNIKIVDVLREKLTLIYSGGMWGGLSREPYQNYYVGMALPCAPENVDKVIAAAFGEIETLQNNGPVATDLDKVKQNWLIAHQKALRENGFWLGTLQDAVLHGTDPAILLNYEKRVAAITSEDLKATAKRYLTRDNYVQMVLQPEK